MAATTSSSAAPPSGTIRPQVRISTAPPKPGFNWKGILLHGAIITIGGILIGNIVAIVLCWLQQRYGFLKLPEEAYYISTAAVDLEWWHVVVVDVGTFIICFLALMIPTMIIKRVQPVKAIQFR